MRDKVILTSSKSLTIDCVEHLHLKCTSSTTNEQLSTLSAALHALLMIGKET